MGRGKLKLELIPNEKSRKTTFLKRSKGLIKKCSQLSTLCDVDVCMIINGGAGGPREQQVRTYPDKSEEVHRIIHRYLTTTKDNPPKKITGLSDFFVDEKKKLDSELSKLYKAKYPVSDELIDQYCPNGDPNELLGFLNLLDERIKEAEEMIQQKKQNQQLDHDQLHGGDDHGHDFDSGNQGPHYPIPVNKHIAMSSFGQAPDHHQFVSNPMTNIGQSHGYGSHAPSGSNYSNIDPFHHQGYYNDPMSSTTGPVVEDPNVQFGMLENYGMFGKNNVNSNPSCSSSYGNPSSSSSSMMMRQYYSGQPQQPLMAVMPPPYMRYASMPLQLPGNIPSYYDHQQQMHGNGYIDQKAGEIFDENSEFRFKNNRF
ncbi:hypothetical protein FNV43_RR01933 [Rhamnella rubrinervis]|uniref:MADS-box domain-containing protein n=1 Tax=Rhamnella rubrinervis TaxID=2594499 RepID=A0A8K0HQJ3_9ROSA|nr:hypothetical protein FNV43_RR01933 [Rhamnella rubrinervis]